MEFTLTVPLKNRCLHCLFWLFCLNLTNFLETSTLYCTVYTLHSAVLYRDSLCTVLFQVFERHGLVRDNPLGEKFDPNKHNALFQVTKHPPPTHSHTNLFYIRFIIRKLWIFNCWNIYIFYSRHFSLKEIILEPFFVFKLCSRILALAVFSFL